MNPDEDQSFDKPSTVIVEGKKDPLYYTVKWMASRLSDDIPPLIAKYATEAISTWLPGQGYSSVQKFQTLQTKI